MIHSHLDTIENTEDLKRKLEGTTYAPIIFNLEEGFNKIKMPEAAHLADKSGKFTTLAAKFVELKLLTSRLRSCRTIGSFYSLLKYSCQSFFLSSPKPMVLGLSTAEKLSLLNEALTKIDLQLIKNISYTGQIFAEYTATFIRDKLKPKLMARPELSRYRSFYNLPISQIAELINFDYMYEVEQKYGGRLTFAVFLNIESASVKAAKISAIENEINHYKDALAFIIATNNSIIESAQIQTQLIADELWSSIEKKVNTPKFVKSMLKMNLTS